MKKTAIIAAALLCGGLSAPVLAEQKLTEQEKRDCRMASLKDCVEYGKTELERTTTVTTTTDMFPEDNKTVTQTRQGGREMEKSVDECLKIVCE